MAVKGKTREIPIFEASGIESQTLARLEQLLASSHPKLIGADGERVELPESIYQILLEVTPLLAEGKKITLVPSEHYLTTQEAANLLNISRPYLYQLLDRQEIPYTLVGTHRRIKAQDVSDYKDKRDRQRCQDLAELAAITEEFGLYDSEQNIVNQD